MADSYYNSRAHVPHDSAQSNEMNKDDEDSASIIRGLEEEVRELTEKVASASQRFADYENEIRVLTAQVRQDRRRNNGSTDETATQPQPPSQPSTLSRSLGSFMHARRPTANPPAPQPTPSPSERERELESQLSASETSRQAAEGEVKKVHAEIEELTGSLFAEANGMVSEERQANAKLKERIQFLEARDAKFGLRVRGLEERDRERKGRLERLERAMGAVERVNGVLRKGKGGGVEGKT